MSADEQRTILLVDDDQSLLDIVLLNLKRLYIEATYFTASSAVQALGILKANPVDLLVTDIYMPEMNGFELVVAARKMNPDIKIIVMTAHSSPALTKEVQGMGSVGYIEKPFVTRKLASLIGDTFAQGRKSFDGAIEGIQITDIIQINCISRLSSAIFINNNNREGAVFFENGEIVHAQTDETEGERALKDILSWQSGSFSTKRNVAPPKKTIAKKWEQLLIESLVSIDESNRGDFVLDHDLLLEEKPAADTVRDTAIRVLVVDDSKIITKGITDILSQDGQIQVVGEAKDGKEAVEKVASLKPDVVTMDVNMPEMDGLTALKHIMIMRPTPVVMLSAYTQEGAAATFDSLRFGAIDFIAKPSTRQDLSLDVQKKNIVETVKRAAKVRISSVQHIRLTQKGKNLGAGGKTQNADSVVAMGTALGGYSILLRILPRFSGDLKAAVLVVQYMPEEVIETFCEYLNSYSPIPVKPARDGEVMNSGVCYLCADNHYMTIIREGAVSKIRLNDRPFDFEHRNSFNMLLISLAEAFGERAVGVILTGEGADGLEGAQELKRVGGTIIAQETDTCLSPEMAGQVIQKGLADRIVPDYLLAQEITRAVMVKS
jgi:two-component system, chemotaxis family, protein-glutamate methylesterase/glutaminase